MNEQYYKPLTPQFRRKINEAVENRISELRECEENAFVNAYMVGYNALSTIINALPDGFPIPMERR